jgi:hypothetical protein
MSEEEVFITEFGCSEGTVENEISNVGFFTSKILWHVPCPDFVEFRICWNSSISVRKLRNS